MFRDHGITHFTGPVSHPSSTGLLEHAVQEMMSYVAKKCIEKGTREGWSLTIRDGIVEMNTKLVRIHGYSPAQLMLGYESQQYHFDIEPAPFLEDPTTTQEVPAHQCQIFTALRDETKLLAMEAASYSHYTKSRRDRKQRIPKPGDLVIVRNHTVDNQRGRKLEAKWSGPRAFCAAYCNRYQDFTRPSTHSIARASILSPISCFFKRRTRNIRSGADRWGVNQYTGYD